MKVQDRFKAMAERYRDRFTFAVLETADHQPEWSCYNNVNDVQRSAVDLDSLESLEKFIQTCSRPLIPELTRRNEMEYTTVSAPWWFDR